MNNIIKLRDYPIFLEKSAYWFHQKWGVPLEAYRNSIQACIGQEKGIPQWYIVLNAEQKMIAGAGVIENDFHNRCDLAPNLCALFVEESHRKQGVARTLLDFVRQDLGNMGIQRLYLVTDHTDFYEKCGWEFLTMVQDEEGISERMYTAPTLP